MEFIKRAVLLSGGVDSICLAYHLIPNLAYTVNYGQKSAKREIYISKLICDKLNIRHEIIDIDCSSLGSGSMSNKESLRISPSSEWWPYRNQLLITLALMRAIKDDINEIHLASVKSDFFHKDGTKEFYNLINEVTEYQEGEIRVICNTLDYYSHELANKYNVPIELISMAHSCHQSNIACGVCSGCLKQLRVRQELGIE